MIDTVTFDLWNTLLIHEYHDDRVKNARIERMLDALNRNGHGFTIDEMLKAYDYTEEYLAGTWKEEKDLDIDEHLALFLTGLGLEVEEQLLDVIREPYMYALFKFCPKIIDGAIPLLAGIKSDGYRVGLISNTGRTPGVTIRKILDRYGMSGYFDSMIYSNEVGYIKPNRKIFEIALEKLNASAENTVHIGDSRLLDIYGARSCGMSAILFDRYSAGFEKYAEKYYDAKGRRSEPDATVGSLEDITGVIKGLKQGRR